MIFNSTPQNEAVVSNVGNIGEFRIRNSAKAFGILSSGLYANKIRAVIRELSCNALDSHVAAGRKDVPFDVHLPNQLEPWFAVRDYGLGLNQSQVTNIYTTYFESTKTASNDLIGGLGLGSKSPFAYTDNFTVTATKDGVKGIYTAFINESGVPSIALMTETATDEANGVEVKFSVNDVQDFARFKSEAAFVFMTFEQRPVVLGAAEFKIREREYFDRDIIPGVHTLKNFGGSGAARSYAVMGNVPYPLEVPNAEQNLGNAWQLIHCGLEINFAIGEIDFQASREGLSYVPQTIAAIKSKLDQVRDILAVRLAAEFDALPDVWQQRKMLFKKNEQVLWQSAVAKLIADRKFPLIDATSAGRYLRATKFKLYEMDLASKYNIKLAQFSISSYYNTASNYKPEIDRHATVTPGSDYPTYWSITPDDHVFYVTNDTKVGVIERAKYHWKQRAGRNSNETIFVLSAADKTQAMDTAGFFKELYNPPANQRFLASALAQKDRTGGGGATGPISILKLGAASTSSYRQRMGNASRAWKKVDDVDLSDKTQPARVYYYIGLSGFVAESRFGFHDAKDIETLMKGSGISALTNIELYGVRKADIDKVKSLPNWINVEDFIVSTLTKLDDKFWQSVLLSEFLEDFKFLGYHLNRNQLQASCAADSLFRQVVWDFAGLSPVRSDTYWMDRLLAAYTPGKNNPLEKFRSKIREQCYRVDEAYPLLKYVGTADKMGPSDKVNNILEYVALVDQKRQQEANACLGQAAEQIA